MQYKIFEINKVKLSVHKRKALLGCPPMFFRELNILYSKF